MLRAMKGISLALLAVGVLMLAAAGPADAINDIGEVCFNLLPTFADTIRAEAQVSANIVTLNFRWRSATYELGGSGSVSASTLTPGSFMLALVGAHGTTSFGGNHICSLFATLNPPTFSGPFSIQCSGATTPFAANGTITAVACTAAMSAIPPEQIGGRGVGE